jgi:hypothetical protein
MGRSEVARDEEAGIAGSVQSTYRLKHNPEWMGV